MEVKHRARRDSIAPYETEPSLEVVTVVADAKEVGPMELSPLYDVVDPDTIDSVMQHSDDSFELSFDYDGVRVVVTADEVVVEA
jgi:hypothetical protein